MSILSSNDRAKPCEMELPGTFRRNSVAVSAPGCAIRSTKLAVMLVFGGVVGCRHVPAELPGRAVIQDASRAPIARSVWNTDHEEALRELVSGALDGGVPEAFRRFQHVRSPRGTAFWTVRVGTRWHGVLAEPNRISLGLQAVERAVALRRSEGESVDARELTRWIGAMYLYPHPVFDGEEWVETTESHPREVGPTPRMGPHPAGGQTLLFGYFVASEGRNAGPHIGNFRLTDTGLIIDYAPLPR